MNRFQKTLSKQICLFVSLPFSSNTENPIFTIIVENVNDIRMIKTKLIVYEQRPIGA